MSDQLTRVPFVLKSATAVDPATDDLVVQRDGRLVQAAGTGLQKQASILDTLATNPNTTFVLTGGASGDDNYHHVLRLGWNGSFLIGDVDNGGAAGQIPFYSEGTWSPTATFDTPGDLSVSYTTRNGSYKKFGNLLWYDIQLIFSLTYTTASGIFGISGLPVAIGTPGGFSHSHGPSSVNNLSGSWIDSGLNTPVLGAYDGAQRLYLQSNTAGTVTNFGTSQVPSGGSFTLVGSGFYPTA